MIAKDTISRRLVQKRTITIGNDVFALKIMPVRTLNGKHSLAHTWEVRAQAPITTYVGCGTAPTKAHAEQAITAAISKFLITAPLSNAYKRMARSQA